MCTNAVVKVALTAAAEKFFRRVLRFSGQASGAGVRLTVTAGGCSGYNSDFTVESRPIAGDAAVQVNGIWLFLPEASCALLDGVTIDFLDSPTQTGLTFLHPRSQACGCASSASAGQGPGVARIEIGSIGRATAEAQVR